MKSGRPGSGDPGRPARCASSILPIQAVVTSRAGDGLLGAYRVRADERRGVTGIDEAEAAGDVPDVQVAAAHLQNARAVGVGAVDRTDRRGGGTGHCCAAPVTAEAVLDADVATVKVRPPGPVQVLKVTEVIFPSGLVRPLPFFSVAAVADEAQVRVWPVFTSFSVVLPALPVTAPPGLMVQVVVVVAMAVAVPRPSASAAAPLLRRMAVRCLRM